MRPYPRADRFLNLMRLFGDFRFKRPGEYDISTKASIISSLILIVTPFVPIWQINFEFVPGLTLADSMYVDSNFYNSAFRFQGITQFWAYLLVLIGFLNLILVDFSYQLGNNNLKTILIDLIQFFHGV